MARATAKDPLSVFRYRVDIRGFAVAGFKTASGLEQTTEVSEYREGNQSDSVRKSPGQTSFANIVLTRGVIKGDSDFYSWAQQVFPVDDVPAAEFRRELAIVLQDRSRADARTWEVFEAWPVRFKASSDLDASSNDHAIAELELAHEGFKQEDA